MFCGRRRARSGWNLLFALDWVGCTLDPAERTRLALRVSGAGEGTWFPGQGGCLRMDAPHGQLVFQEVEL